MTCLVSFIEEPSAEQMLRAVFKELLPEAVTTKFIVFQGLARAQNKVKYRNPDRLAKPSLELEKLTQKKYQKVDGSRAIGPHLRTDGTNRSRSFNVLIKGIRKLLLAA